MEQPLVSVIIRTCGRPIVLLNAMESVRKQSYSNVEVVVAEDGPNVSESFLNERFADMNYRYVSTGEKRGRCIVGNLGLELSKGKYCVFLDDDDLLYPSHIETLVEAISKNSVRAVYSIAEERQIIKKNGECKVKRTLVRYKQPFNRLLLCYMNYIPIQSILFERSLYEELGGFDEELELLEDWDLWLRYGLNNDFLFVPQITSAYFTPYRGAGHRNRGMALHHSEDVVRQKHMTYQCSLNAEQISRDMDYILNVFNKKGIVFYMKKIRNYLLYKDI